MLVSSKTTLHNEYQWPVPFKYLSLESLFSLVLVSVETQQPLGPLESTIGDLQQRQLGTFTNKYIQQPLLGV